MFHYTYIGLLKFIWGSLFLDMSWLSPFRTLLSHSILVLSFLWYYQSTLHIYSSMQNISLNSLPLTKVILQWNWIYYSVSLLLDPYGWRVLPTSLASLVTIVVRWDYNVALAMTPMSYPDKVLNFPVPHFTHRWKQNNNYTCLIGISWRLNAMKYLKHLVQYMYTVNAQLMFQKMMVNTRVLHRKVSEATLLNKLFRESIPLISFNLLKIQIIKHFGNHLPIPSLLTYLTFFTFLQVIKGHSET